MCDYFPQTVRTVRELGSSRAHFDYVIDSVCRFRVQATFANNIFERIDGITRYQNLNCY